ncbi:hypothetical protein MLD38_006584 [Melastoma candidum]|uniref:Uncharacterized protein n=1 Tax=Melastoma candidum TaxID=119954 RepID=A0ACB9RSJ7_9MYRT|nr:hypothetical protein MLD38_006584 [Melastoma candidum]
MIGLLGPSLVLVAVLAFLVSFSISVESQLLLAREQQTLLRLKKSWNNPAFLDSWVASSNVTSHCGWPGVTCLGGSVTELNLYYKGIGSPIPGVICDLENLTVLNIGNNSIPGGFPTVLYGCSKLSYLDISQNYFVGPLPSEIYQLSGLWYLSVTGNNFSSDIPESIVRLKNLRELHINQNQFNGSYPDGIFGMSSLEVLNMADNYRLLPSRMPGNFSVLERMRYLQLTNMNLFGEIPDSVGAMVALEYLDFGRNNLTGTIPDGIFKLKNLTNLFLWETSLSGSIPRVVESLYLTEIDLSNNNLVGNIPEDFGKLQRLSLLVLINNDLSGPIPDSIGRLPSLRNFRIFGNHFSGLLPPDFGRYSALEVFEVALNNFTGILPDNLCYGGKLAGLTAFSNNLTGHLPTSLGNCSSLIQVTVYDNVFSGNVPKGLWTLSNLTTLNLHDNMFSGELPTVFSGSLTHIVINHNKFFGRIPSGLSSARNLQVFDASNNLLNGTIPIELTDLPQLNTLLLDGNQISGEIPTFMVSWNSLGVLNLSGNQISGRIPVAFGLLRVLTELDLSENQLSGPIPPQLGERRLSYLNLSNNNLTGPIPQEFENGAYADSFLNNPDLCSSSPSVKLQPCVAGSGNSRKAWSKNIALIISMTIVVFVLALAVFYVIFSFKKKNNGFDPTLKLTPFQRLSFTGSDIISGLNEQNVIGSGGSGKVYRVLLSRSSDVVAVKMICNSRKLEHKLEKEFSAEVEILGRIRHVNVVKLLCCISCENVKYLVYEYMPNRSLDQWLQKKRRPSSEVVGSTALLDWPKRLHIAIGAAQGLSYMHHDCSLPIIHRDIKSSNILIDADFNAKIADFGLARMLLVQGESATVSAVAGSFGYLAPEYGHTHRVNEKIDVYSFGVVLLELTTGKVANDADDDLCLAEWAWRHVQEDNPIVDALDPDIRDESNLNEMISVFKLGIFCTGTFPSTRPNMKQVVEYLLRYRDGTDPDGKNMKNNSSDASSLLLKIEEEAELLPPSDGPNIEYHTY